MKWFRRERQPIEQFSKSLFEQVAIGVDRIRKLSEDKTSIQDRYGLTNLEWFGVFWEFHNVYLHFTDREAFRQLGAEARSAVMDELGLVSVEAAVRTICAGWPEERIQSIKDEAIHNLNIANQEYGGYKKVYAKPEESPEDTLLWEFGKNVAEQAGRPMDITYVMESQLAALAALKVLDFGKFVGDRAR